MHCSTRMRFMSNIVMLTALMVVAGTSLGVYFWFTRRLNAIEEELWGQQKHEAERTAMSDAGEKKETAAESGVEK